MAEVVKQPAMCKCISYNRPDLCDSNGTPEVVLETPAHIPGRPNGICVDACIAGVMGALWEHRHVTYGCCCGHNRTKPSVLIGESENPEEIRAIIAAVDPREWDVMQWRLVAC